jgi:tripartite-type tricarboxylate transporter receptor subunit TctC
MITRRQFSQALGSATAVAITAPVTAPVLAAEAYPQRPIRLLVGLAPGGITDQVARIVSVKLGEILGQQIVVETRTGAGGAIAAKAVRDAAPDGYTLGIAFDGTFATAPAANPNLGFDPVKDFAPISKVVDSPVMITSYNDFPDKNHPAKDFGEFVRLARSALTSNGSGPKVLDYGTAGVASTGHLAMELIKKRVGIFAVHIPYRGGGDVRFQVLGKQIPLMLAAVPATSNDVRTGLLKGLAVTSAKRSPAVPDVPTLAELGIKELADLDINSWVGLVAPLKTAPDIIARLHQGIKQMLANPDTQAALIKIGAVPVGNSPAEFAQQMADDVARWKAVIKDSALKLDGMV